MNPTLILKFIGGSVGLGGGIAGSVFSSFQAFTKISIEEFLKDDWFDYTEDSEWQILKKKLNDSQNTDDKKLESIGLKEIKKQNGVDDSQNQNGEKNKNWCKNKKTFKIKKLLPSSFDSLLLDYIKSFCLITIEEKLTTATTGPFTELETDRSTLTTNTGKLESHNNDNNGDLSKEKELENIKTIENSNSKKEKALLDWCQKTYKKTYKNSSDNLWKLADYYCKKTTSPGR